MKKLLLAALIMAVMAMPAFASVQNVKISGSVHTTGLYREDIDLGEISGSTTGRDHEVQNILFSSTKLQVDADLIENVSATVALINERVWTLPSSGSTDISLNLAYVTLREMLYSPMTVVVGRQAFSYGNQFIISSAAMGGGDSLLTQASDLSEQNSQDAVRLIFDYDPLTVELLWAKINENGSTSLDSDVDDRDLYGINATYELGDQMQTVVEGYFFANRNRNTGPDDVASSAAGDISNKTDTIYVPGIRVSTNPLESLNIQAEYAHQSGTKADSTDASNQQERNANAFQFISNYMIPVLEEYNPIFSYSYTWASGDNDTLSEETDTPGEGEERWTQWDPMYNYQGVGTIANSLFVTTNCHIHSWSLQANPMEDLTVKGTLIYTYLDKKVGQPGDLAILQPDATNSYVPAAYNPTSPSRTVGIGATGHRDLYKELDFDAKYAYTEDVEIGASMGWLFPGKAILGQYKNVASQALVHLNVDF